ncbi:MAG TPA: glucosamine-6-phosphate deaminase [Candidatus Hydrogenedentes bacterium]|nr:glucosamine-6-phosphate deaminase [Candidatus Hydrogenedentota bacterium]
MEVIIRETPEDAAELVATIMGRAIAAKPRIVLGLATGRTMELVYERLVSLHEEEGLDFALVTTFNLDEYIGLPPEDPHSYRHYMNKHLFHRVNIDPRSAHLPDGIADDIDAECAHYEALIAECGGVDLQLLGIGRSGHIGFNEPLSAMRSRTRAKALSPQTVAQNQPLFTEPHQMPRRAITMGVGTILDCKRCVLLATGDEKADIIAKAVEGPVTAMISASALQLHPRCTIVVDRSAAAKLEHADYYAWIFENEPEWEPFR